MNYVFLGHVPTPSARAGRTALYAKSDGLIYFMTPAGEEVAVGVSLERLLPAGGVAGQVLKKIDGADYNVTWGNDLTEGGGAGVSWGGITGTLSSQTDLNTALAGKAGVSHSHPISDVTSLQTALDGKAAASHGHAASEISSIGGSTYTPTVTGVANVTGTTALGDMNYLRVGSTCVVSGRVRFTPSNTSSTCRVGISLPFASDFTNVQDCAGSASTDAGAAKGEDGAIIADATNNRAELAMVASTLGQRDMSLIFLYWIH